MKTKISNTKLSLVLALLSYYSINSSIAQTVGFSVDTSLNNAKQQMQNQKDKIVLTSTKETDYFIEPAGAYEKSNAPLLLKKIDNANTFIIKFTAEHKAKYDAGMAFIYVDEKHWLKFAHEADERLNTRIVTVRTNESSDDNNHEIVKAKTVYLKISSDTKQIGFYYSIDGRIWNLVRIFKNEYPGTVYIGVGTQSPAGNGNKTIFEKIEFKDTAVKDFRAGL